MGIVLSLGIGVVVDVDVDVEKPLLRFQENF